jgi:hypothetical protein
MMFFLMGTLMMDPFVGFLNMDKKIKVESAKTFSKAPAKVHVKKLKKETILRKGKSQ